MRYSTARAGEREACCGLGWAVRAAEQSPRAKRSSPDAVMSGGRWSWPAGAASGGHACASPKAGALGAGADDRVSAETITARRQRDRKAPQTMTAAGTESDSGRWLAGAAAKVPQPSGAKSALRTPLLRYGQSTCRYSRTALRRASCHLRRLVWSRPGAAGAAEYPRGLPRIPIQPCGTYAAPSHREATRLGAWDDDPAGRPESRSRSTSSSHSRWAWTMRCASAWLYLRYRSR